jgi:signal transduction histidine kinase
VIACNNDGLWNEQGATLDFSVAPAWYQTTWFRVSCTATLLMLLYLLYQLRVRQLHHQFSIGLEARFNERTRIARELHDTLLQSFQGLMLRFQTVGEMLPARPLDAKNALEGALDRADQAISEGRDVITDIRATTLASRDLEKSITALMTNLSEELAAGNGRSATFRVLVEGVPRAVRPTLQDEIHRIARELVFLSLSSPMT